MQVDLRLLKHHHPLLPASLVRILAHCAAIALDRQRHEPGIGLQVRLDAFQAEAVLDWDQPRASDVLQFDQYRVTEDGAEAIALSLVSSARGWVVLRRLQRGEFADWLLRDSEGQRIALEVSGIAGSLDMTRLSEKLQQISRARITPLRYACVVAFARPEAALSGL